MPIEVPITHPVLIEAYVETLDQALAAQTSGADRLELCGPGDGGLTPTIDIVNQIVEAVSIPTHVMIRPRAGDFNYSPDEFT
jgi:copper homeostasis protein